MKVIFKDIVIAESDATVVVEGNHYFPPSSVNKDFLQDSTHQTTCPWKGEAHYYDVVIGDEVLENPAWYYPEPKEGASQIQDHVAFWGEVEIVE